jgi:hypothetical protein
MAAGLAQSLNAYDLSAFFLSHPVLMTGFGTGASLFQQSVVYGNPYPSAWPAIFIVSTAVAYDLVVNGETHGNMGQLMTLSSSPGTAAAPLQALLSPVRNPGINGLNLFVNQTGVGTEPVLSWDPPSLGVPSLYQIYFWKVNTSAAGFWLSGDAASNLTTFGTSVQVPPGILKAGSMYVINIRAVATGNPGAKNAPFRLALPFALADCMSAVIRP